MVGIQGLGGIPEPKPERPAKVRNERETQAAGGLASATSGGSLKADDVQISSEAQAAAEVSRVLQLARGDDDVRLDRVEAARQSIERGDYRQRDVVFQTAEKLLKYLT